MNEEAKEIANLLRSNGEGCNCNAWSSSECACDATWGEAYTSQGADTIDTLVAANSMLIGQRASLVVERDALVQEVERLRESLADFASAAVSLQRYIAEPKQEQAEPVPQFRKVGCADWYDGFPDHSDGGGPYESRTLYTAPQGQAELLKQALEALEKLSDAADGFNVSGVYFNEELWGKECLGKSYDAIAAIKQHLDKQESVITIKKVLQ